MRYIRKVLSLKPFALFSIPVLLILFLACARQVYGAEIDLEVINIERNPKYESHQGGMVRYMNAEYLDDFTPYEVDSAIGLLNPDAQQWPTEGEAVTFTAHIRNRGTSPVAVFHWTWRVDGVPVGSGSFEGSLQPDSETTFSYVWEWSSERHTVGFEVSVAGDATPANNQITDFTDALSFFALIEEGFDERFRLNTPQVPHPKAAYMTEWLQHHIRRFNEMFEVANAPTRVRYDRLKIVADGSKPGGCEPECQRWDGAFPAVWTASSSDLRLDGYFYYEESEDIEYGLLHELGHQLGLVDLYRINMGPENNKVNGWPYQHPYQSAPLGLMHGVSPMISSHTAGALTRWHGFRRGYFGQYLYDLPAHNFLLIQGACGTPLADARVEVYQKISRVGGDEEVPDQAKFSGKTSSSGLFELPNVEIDPTNFPAIETGNVLAPNPFGYISNHSENGLFLIKMYTTAEASWEFIDITRFNEAYWGGETETSTYEIQAALVRHPIPGNQAYGRPASADIPESFSGWCKADFGSFPSIPEKANDGDSTTVWCRDRLEPGDYWQVDLGREMWIYRSELVANYKGYRVEGSLADAFAGEQNLLYRETDGLNYDGAPLGIYGFPPVLARYIRLTTESPQDWTILREIRFFAAQGPCGWIFSDGFETRADTKSPNTHIP